MMRMAGSSLVRVGSGATARAAVDADRIMETGATLVTLRRRCAFAHQRRCRRRLGAVRSRTSGLSRPSILEESMKTAVLVAALLRLCSIAAAQTPAPVIGTIWAIDKDRT